MTTHTYIHTYIHTHIHTYIKTNRTIWKAFLSILSFFVALQNFFFLFVFFGHLTLRKKHSDKFVLLYMKILTVHGIQQCASSFVVSAWR